MIFFRKYRLKRMMARKVQIMETIALCKRAYPAVVFGLIESELSPMEIRSYWLELEAEMEEIDESLIRNGVGFAQMAQALNAYRLDGKS